MPFLSLMDAGFVVTGVSWFLRILSWLIIARILFSWIVPHAQGPIIHFLMDITEPILRPLRNLLPRGSGTLAMIDWSPLVALILLDVVRAIVFSLG